MNKILKFKYENLPKNLKEFVDLMIVANCLSEGMKANDKVYYDLGQRYEWWLDENTLTMVDVVQYTDTAKDYHYIDTVII